MEITDKAGASAGGPLAQDQPAKERVDARSPQLTNPKAALPPNTLYELPDFISDEEALHIREVSEEKLADESIRQTVVAHKTADLPESQKNHPNFWTVSS